MVQPKKPLLASTYSILEVRNVWCRVTYKRSDYPDTSFTTTVNVNIDEKTSTPEKLLDAIRGGQVADRWKYLGQLMTTDRITIAEVHELLGH
jgi:hypothetical protein